MNAKESWTHPGIEKRLKSKSHTEKHKKKKKSKHKKRHSQDTVIDTHSIEPEVSNEIEIPQAREAWMTMVKYLGFYYI